MLIGHILTIVPENFEHCSCILSIMPYISHYIITCDVMAYSMIIFLQVFLFLYINNKRIKDCNKEKDKKNKDYNKNYSICRISVTFNLIVIGDFLCLKLLFLYI